MRIISGSLKGRKIAFPNLKNAEALTRPTTDVAREGLFNWIQHRQPLDEIESPWVLDLFSGTGAVGLEFISRGAARVDFVEKSSVCVDSIQQHAEQFGLSSLCNFSKADAFSFLTVGGGGARYDYIFADPPYALPQLRLLPQIILDSNRLLPTGLLIIEHDDRHNFQKVKGWIDCRSYGKSRFSFFEHVQNSDSEAGPE